MAPAKLLAAPAKGVAARSIRRTRWPRCASVRACQRPVIPAPTTVITAVCMTCAGAWRALFSSPLWRSIPEGQALAARVGPAFEQTVGAPDDQVRARGQKVGADAVSVRLHFERMPDRRRLVNFDFEGPAAAAEVHERRRGLGVELPVYQTDQGFDDVRMMRDPPGEPSAAHGVPVASKTMVGAIELRGRFPGASALAMGLPAASIGRKAKSVSSLLSRKPAAHRREPKAASMLLVMATTLPAASTTEKWLVPAASTVASMPSAPPLCFCGLPGRGRGIAVRVSIRPRRPAR